MKFKALRLKKTGEFVRVENYFGKYEMYTSEFPNPQPMTATLQGMIEYFEKYKVVIEGVDWNDYEMVTLECHEISGE